MQACCHGEHLGHEGEAAHRTRISLIFIGTAFVLNAFVGDWIYPDNGLISEISAAEPKRCAKRVSR